MEILTVTQTLAIAEMEMDEECDKQSLIFQINSNLTNLGLKKWKSIEAESYTYKKSVIIFAKPINVLIPKFLFDIIS